MDLIKIGTYIAGKRKALGMTQKQLAEQLGMSDKSVSKVRAVLCAVPLAGPGGAVQPLKQIRHGRAVVAVVPAVAVGVGRLLRVEAFQGNDSFRYQAHAVRRLAADLEADHSAVILRVDRLHDRADGKRRQLF